MAAIGAPAARGGQALPVAQKAPAAQSGIAALLQGASLTPKDLASARTTATNQVNQAYNATPMPSVTSYLQPFVNQNAQNNQDAADYHNWLTGAASAAGGVSSAFGTTVANALGQGQAATVAQGGSGLPGAVPSAAASMIPMSGIGANYQGFLNAEVPVAAQMATQANSRLSTAENSALGTYNTEANTRQQAIRDAIDKLYQSTVTTLGNTKQNYVKDALTAYALGDKNALALKGLAQKGQIASTNAGLTQQKIDQAGSIADRKLALQQQKDAAQIKRWQTQSAAGTKSGIKGLSGVMKALNGGQRYTTKSNDYQVIPVYQAGNLQGATPGTPTGAKPITVHRGPNQGAPAYDPKTMLLADGSGKLVSTAPTVVQSKTKVATPLTAAEWDQAAANLGIANGWTPQRAQQYLATYTPRPAR